MRKEDIRRGVLAALPTLPKLAHVRRLSLFGSFLRDEANEQSDIDLQVEFSDPVGLFDLMHMEQHCAMHLGRPVDLVTPRFVSRYIRDEVMQSAELLYAQEG